MSDPTISRALQSDFSSYVYDRAKVNTATSNTTTPAPTNLKEALSDDKIDKGEYEALKAKYTGGDATKEADFDASLAKTLGISTERLAALKSADNNPVEIRFTSLGDNNVAVHTDDLTNGATAIVDTGAASEDVAVKKGGKGYDYSSQQAKTFAQIAQNTGAKVIKSSVEIAEGAEGSKIKLGDFLKDAIPEDIQPDPKAKLNKAGDKEIQRLQAYIGLPPERQDGVFGAETMANLKKQYAEAMKSGVDKDKVETLGSLLEGLDKVINTDANAPKDASLSTLAKTHGNAKDKFDSLNLAKNSIGTASQALKDANDGDFGKAVEIANNISNAPAKERTMTKLSDMASQNIAGTISAKSPGPLKGDSLIKLMSENGSPANKAMGKAFEALYEKKDEAGQASWSLKPNLEKLNALTADEIKLLPADVQKVVTDAQSGAKIEKKQADEAPHIQTLSDEIINPQKTLVGRDHIEALKDADSTPRGKAVTNAFNALYSTVGGTGGGKNEKWEYKPDAAKLSALSTNAEAMKQLSQSEKTGLLKGVDKLPNNDQTKAIRNRILYSMQENTMDAPQQAIFKASMAKLDDNQKAVMMSQTLLNGKNDDFAAGLLKGSGKSVQKKVATDLINKSGIDKGVALGKATAILKNKGDMFADDPAIAAKMISALSSNLAAGGDKSRTDQILKDLAEFQKGINSDWDTGKVVAELRKINPELPGLITRQTGIAFEDD